MSTTTRSRSTALALTTLLCAACDAADPSLAVLDNAYPVSSNTAQQTVVFKAWWAVTEFPDPVSAGQSSDDERVIPESDYAYMLLAPGWNPASTEPPVHLIPVRTKSKVSVARGDRLHIVVADQTVDGDCAAGTPLSQDDADFITQRIFPGDFQGLRYDAATCTAMADPSEPSARD